MSEILFSSNSMLDDFGRVFYFDNKIYRGISKASVSECQDLLKSPFFIELISKGYVPKTKISNICVGGYDLVLEHEKLLNVLQHEWTFSMLRDAALMVLEVNNICGKHGYELKDAHTLNVLFRGNKPVYVDIGSFRKKTNDNWCAYFEFVSCFVVPLVFWSEGKFYITRKLLESNFYRMQTIPNQSIYSSGLLRLFSNKLTEYVLTFRGRKVFRTRNRNNLLNFVSKLGNKIASIIRRVETYPIRYEINYKKIECVKKIIVDSSYPEVNSLWKDYHTKYYNKEGNLIISSRFKRIIEIINALSEKNTITSALDLAGNEGLMSFSLEKYTSLTQIILADYDENALENAFHRRKEKDSNINIALLNFMFTPNIEGTAERFRSDIVLVLAVTHHLLLTSQFLLATILERIKMFSNKYVFVEFMPKGLWSLDTKSAPPVPDWYTVDWFRSEFVKYFTIENEEQLEENRILFVGKVM